MSDADETKECPNCQHKAHSGTSCDQAMPDHETCNCQWQEQPRRVTGKQFLRAQGIVNFEEYGRDALLGLGARAARIAAGTKLMPVKVREEGFNVHTWPVEVWQRAMGGENAAARPASQRQVAYLVGLIAGRTGAENAIRWAMDYFGGPDRNEDEVGEMIRKAGG